MHDPRAIILRRRARFVAASLAAAGIVVAGPARADDAGDASTDAADAASPIDGGSDVQEPQACLCACALPASGDVSGAATAAMGAAALLLARRTTRKARGRAR